MTGNEIRKRFLEYFQFKGHERVEDSSLVPSDDPTLLFTNAGMVQFKKVFMGEEKRGYVRAATSQRCVRAGGKHNDLENVGYTARHHTFFEMLGNFSFGDYFKKEAIAYAWEFLTKELGLPPQKLWVSVFRDDDEAYELWEQVEDLPAGRIVRLGEKDNFWAMGDTGPCGPCSEIHIDQGVEAGCGGADCAVGCDCDRFLELWNLVFMQYNRSEDGEMTPLPKPSIDTGMGLERITAVLQGKLNNFDSDLFLPIIEEIADRSGKKYGLDPKDDTAMRVIADHARATAFLTADGVLPSNEGRGYVLRRIMRRAIRFGRTLGFEGEFFGAVCDKVTEVMGHAFPHLVDAAELLGKVTHNEESRFGETLDHGLTMLDGEINRLTALAVDSPVIDGEFIFKLYDTYGFPMDIVRDLALEKGVGFDEAGFHKAMEKQRAMSRSSWKGEDVEHLSKAMVAFLEQGKKSEFVGYVGKEARSRVECIIDSGGNECRSVESGTKVKIFCPVTPFYAESGGQVGDKGVISWEGGSFLVETTNDVVKGVTFHEGVVTEGTLSIGQDVSLEVQSSKRNAVAANHTATHLLQAAMKGILGNHVKQAGSLVQEERLRFDFTHFSPLTDKEIRTIERLVNAMIRSNAPVEWKVLAKEEAIGEGATALFGEKYGDRVRVVSIADFSKELCGGTHIGATGEIGFFKIIQETGIAAGVRRIEALTGEVGVRWVQQQAKHSTEICETLAVTREGVLDKVNTLLKRNKKLEQEVAALTAQLALSDIDQLFADAVEVEGIKVITGRVTLDSPKTLREIGDKVRDKLQSGVAVLGGEIGGKAALLALVSKDLTKSIKAGLVVSEVAKIVGGKGGGRPDMAQAGGPMADKVGEAIAAVPDIVSTLLKK
ncbi:MAG: alanine--tRNA ligase [Desulfobulbaceae bacterium]|nr:alanine--tRNA ligase [Desulfobulbaceae bacterium]